MNDLVLYRKYRPQTFSEVVGQSHVVEVLTQAVKDKRLAHAYLFFGPRGTGKTSVARILASTIGAKPSDIYEIDAASNTGVDDIRELRELVKSMPMESPYKVYIIDEVHMLSKSAFNALLKTLEEPPQHVIFILATTEKEKVPDTVVSRCQSFIFKMPAKDALKAFTIDIAKREGKTMDAPSAELIALVGDGSFRDTLVMLQKVLTVVGKDKIDAKEVARVVGAPKFELVNQLLSALSDGNLSQGLTAVQLAQGEEVDMKLYLRLVLEKMRAVLFLRYAPQLENVLSQDFTPDDMALIKKFAQDKARRINSNMLREFLSSYNLIGFAAISSLPVELTLIKLLGEEEKLIS